VAEDRAVITVKGLIGRTVAVTERTADVLLLSDPACRVSVRVAGPGVFGVAEGLGARPGEPLRVRIQYLAHDADVQPGHEVVTSGMGGLFPRGLLVGHVDRVELAEGGLYQTAWVEPAAALESLEFAFVAATEADLAAAEKGRIDELIDGQPDFIDEGAP